MDTAKPIARKLSPLRLASLFQQFTHLEASGGIVLLGFTIIALIWANSPWADSYASLWQTPFTIGGGAWMLSKPLLLWINDGLMAIFFFVVGLEIKREVLIGELASVRRALLPIAAAAGGMIAPALIYLAFNAPGEGVRGWGIPMATDIAFSLGVLALLGSRAPAGLKVFLVAFAIVDDIGAVLVIALFYTAELHMPSLMLGAGILMLLILANVARIRRPLVYVLLGVALWVAVLKSGIHATVAGVLLAMTIPAKARIDATEFVTRGRALFDEFENETGDTPSGYLSGDQMATVQALEDASEQVAAPLQRLEQVLHPWVTYAILPLFALANAGVTISLESLEQFAHPVSIGVIVGLVLGKQLGISVAAWLAVQSGLAAMPESATWRQIYGVAWLGGIGFTMSLFIASLAFGASPLLPIGKLSILTASVIAGIGGYVILRMSLPAESA